MMEAAKGFGGSKPASNSLRSSRLAAHHAKLVKLEEKSEAA